MSDWNSFQGAARRLDDIDLPRIGYRIGVGEDELHAFMDVEAAGSGFDAKGRPKMLFEPHVFYRNLSGAKRDKAVAAGLAYSSWGEKPYPADSYARLEAARKIDETAAFMSASWGLTQILGENFAMVGYETVQDMVRAFMEDEENHLKAMVEYLIAADLADDIRNHRWAAVARGYNGPAYAKHGYHTRMARAYAKWAKIPNTPWTPPADSFPPILVKMVSRGMRGDAVRALQLRLLALGHYAGAIDGVFGPQTEAAVEAFQRSAGVLVDGYAGPQTLSALTAALVGEEAVETSPEPEMEAAMPAPIGHNGGPALDPMPAPRPSPMEQASKAKGAGKGVMKGTGFAGAVITLLLAFNVLPAELNTAEVGAALGIVVTGVASFIWGIFDAYMAPRNAE